MTESRCALCTEHIDQWTKDDHHRTKRSKGGQDTAENLVWICTRCHRMIHVCESFLRRGRTSEYVRSYLRSVLSHYPHVPVEETTARLFDAAKQAAFTTTSVNREVVVRRLRIPSDMLSQTVARAGELNVSTNDLILWALRELLNGRVLLPKSRSI